MFEGREVSLDLGFGVARARLAGLSAGDWLCDASGEAFAEGYADLAHLGPPGGTCEIPGLARVQFLPPQPHDEIMIVPLRWEVAGRSGGLLAVLDADIVLIPAGECTRLAVAGSYRPPMEWFGRRGRQSRDTRGGRRDIHRVAAQGRHAALPRGVASRSAASGQPAG